MVVTKSLRPIQQWIVTMMTQLHLQMTDHICTNCENELRLLKNNAEVPTAEEDTSSSSSNECVLKPDNTNAQTPHKKEPEVSRAFLNASLQELGVSPIKFRK